MSKNFYPSSLNPVLTKLSHHPKRVTSVYHSTPYSDRKIKARHDSLTFSPHTRFSQHYPEFFEKTSFTEWMPPTYLCIMSRIRRHVQRFINDKCLKLCRGLFIFEKRSPRRSTAEMVYQTRKHVNHYTLPLAHLFAAVKQTRKPVVIVLPKIPRDLFAVLHSPKSSSQFNRQRLFMRQRWRKSCMTKCIRKPLSKILDKKTGHIHNEYISCEHSKTFLVDELIENVVISHHTHYTFCSQEKVAHDIYVL